MRWNIKHQILLDDRLIEIDAEKQITRRWIYRKLFESPTLRNNPLFNADLRHVRWPRTADEISRFALLFFIIVACAMGLLVVVDLKTFGHTALIVLIDTALIGNIAITLGGDAMLLLTTSSRIARQIETGQWEELQLTTLTAHKIYEAKSAINELRARRFMLVTMVLRILPLIAILLLITLDIYDQGFFLSRFFRTWLTEGYAIIMISLFIPPLIAYFGFIEPYWQMHTLVALSLLIPLLVRHVLFNALTGVIALVMLRSIQVFMLGAMLLMFLWLANLQNAMTFCLWSPIFLIGSPLSLFLFHRAVRHYSETWAEKLIFPRR